MKVLTIDEQNKQRIQDYIHRPEIYLYDYERDVELLEQSNQLTEKLAQEIFENMMKSCQTTRDIIEPKGELKEELLQIYEKFDNIPKPENDYYDDAYGEDMELDDVYKNMQTCFEFFEIEQKHNKILETRRIAESAISSINATDRLDIPLDKETKESLRQVKAELENSLGNEKTDVAFIQEKVEKYNEFALKIWNDYLTKVEDGKENDFRYLIHNCSRGEINGDLRTKNVSSSLITNRTMGVFGSKAKYGFILKPKHIVSADYRDTYTYNYREDGQELFNIKPPIKLPQEIEEICIEQTIAENGEMLNYDTTNIYSEAVVDEYEVEGIYYISNGEKELSPNYENAKRMAEKREIPLKELDISKCRKDNGLEPMTEKTQKDFCRNILQKYCYGNQELERNFYEHGDSFIENNYKIFYERYKDLKEKEEYSVEDIQKEFKTVILDSDVQRWKMFEFYHPGFFTGELTTENLQYIIDSRYDFSKCNSYEEFEQLYTSLCYTLEGRFIDDKLEEYVNKRFANKETLLSLKGDKTMLQKLFESGNMSIDNIEQEINNPSVNLWMNRFNTWYSAIDRVPQNEKASFVKMESDIINAISNTSKEITNKKEQNQDSNEK